MTIDIDTFRELDDFSSVEFEHIEPYPDGSIPASRRYVEYGGQVIIRHINGTIQRWVKSSENGDCAVFDPYILSEGRFDDVGGDGFTRPMNPRFDVGQFSVFFVDTGEVYLYEIL